MTITYLDETSDLGSILVGHRIVSAEILRERPQIEGEDPNERWTHLDGLNPYGLLVLDDGTKIYAVGNDGGCACSSGCYSLTKLATVDNIITAAKVIESAGDDSESYEGRYSIFVVAEAQELTVAEFEGSDGNGYYGTGFHLAVVRAA